MNVATDSLIDEEIQLLERKRTVLSARESFRQWCLLCGQIPAKHHDLIINKLQKVAESATQRFIILLMPPGAAKSTYTSATYPPWYLGKCPGNSILACSYAKDLAASFGRRGRNLVEEKSNILGYSLSADSKAADEWETSTGGRYFCAGVGSGIAGHRADLGLIDDYLGNQEDADSLTTRDKQWNWFLQDFFPRLKPRASIVIIANRRHEDDLVGRLTDPENKHNINSPIVVDKWEVIKLPFFAEANDPLGRQVGERLWPEWFTEETAVQVNRLPPRVKAGLYQQRPAPDEGDYFKQEWLVGYERQDLPPLGELRVYAASDHAISKKDDANKTVMGLGGLDSKGQLYILPYLFWQRADAEEQIEEMLKINRMYRPIFWRAEKGHITQSLGPFLRKRMREERNYINLREVTAKKDKPTRARGAQGFMATGRILVPKFAEWWPAAEHQLLTFPASTEDDFVDFLAHLCNEVENMTTPDLLVEVEEELTMPELTYDWLKQSSRRREELVEA